MSAHNLLSKCERALAAYLIAEGAGTAADVYPAKRSLDKGMPCTVCYCPSATEAVPYSGTYIVHAQISVRTQAAPEEPAYDPDQPRDDSDDRIARTFDAFHRFADNSSGDQLAQAITEAGEADGISDITIMNVDIKGPSSGFEEKGSGWLDTLNLELVAAPADNL